MQRLAQADVVVAEVSTPSLGVWYEIGMAEAMGKPIFCLFRVQEHRRLSAMIAWGSHVKTILYTDYEDAIHHIDQFFASLSAKT